MTAGALIELLDRYTSDTEITINGSTSIDVFEELNESCVCEAADFRTKQKTA